MVPVVMLLTDSMSRASGSERALSPPEERQVVKWSHLPPRGLGGLGGLGLIRCPTHGLSSLRRLANCGNYELHSGLCQTCPVSHPVQYALPLFMTLIQQNQQHSPGTQIKSKRKPTMDKGPNRGLPFSGCFSVASFAFTLVPSFAFEPEAVPPDSIMFS